MIKNILWEITSAIDLQRLQRSDIVLLRGNISLKYTKEKGRVVRMKSKRLISYLSRLRWVLAILGILIVGLGSYELGKASNWDYRPETIVSSNTGQLESADPEVAASETTEVGEIEVSNNESNVKKRPVDPNSDGELIYSDENMSISKNGDIIVFRNLTDKKMIVSGSTNLNNSKVVDEQSFGYIGDIQPYGVASKDISTVDLFDMGEEGDIQGESFGDRKVFIHKMKDGDILNWSGLLLNDESFERIGQINVDIPF